jgi:hypothetical protein
VRETRPQDDFNVMQRGNGQPHPQQIRQPARPY